jgi:glycosyltransferase involved in cell wall biosynthesis
VHVTTADMAVRFLLRDQLRYLQNAGYEVSAICSEGPWVEEIRADGIPVRVIPMRRAITPFADLAALVRLYRCFRRERFLVVHTHTAKANLLGQLAARLAGVRARIFTLHGYHAHIGMPGWQRRLYALLDRASCRCAHWVFSQGHEDAIMAVRENICPASKMRYLGNGIDVRWFQHQEHRIDGAGLRSKLGFPPDAPVVAIVGRVTFKKGYGEFIDAAALIRSHRQDVRFLAIGPDDDPSEASLHAQVKRLRLENCFCWLGMQTNMPEWYALMSVMALPSYREGLPRVIMEAAASSVPVVASDIPACRELIEPGRTGLLVPVKNSRALGEAILQVLSDPDRARDMGVRARLKAEREFDQVPVFERVRDAYAELLGAPLNTRHTSHLPKRHMEEANARCK